MGKRSRKRPVGDRPTTTREERDALRATAFSSKKPGAGRSRSDLPPAPWSPFPLTELVVLIGIVCFVWGAFTFGSDRGRLLLFAGMVLGSLGGLEVSVREHFAGRKSHTTLLAGAVGVTCMVALVFAFAILAGASVAGYTTAIVLGLGAFLIAFRLFRDAFRKRSGGLTFR